MTRKIKGNFRVENDTQLDGGINLPNKNASRALKIDSSNNLVESTVTETELERLSGVTGDIQTQLDAKQETSEKGQANGYASLDGSGKVPAAQLPNAIMEYQGVWDASTNTPSLADGGGNSDEAIGNVYRVSVAGTQDLGSGSQTYAVGDYVILNSSKVWEKADTTDAVSSVFGRTGTVVAAASDYDADQIDYDNATSSLTATDVQAAIDEVEGRLDTAETNIAAKQDDVITTEGDLVIGDNGGEESRLPIGTNGQVLTSNGTTATWEDSANSAGDIAETSFSAANNQAVAADVTGLAFVNATVRSFDAVISVEIDATADLFEAFRIQGIQKGGSWDIAVEAVGDNSNVNFTITAAGQIQYTSGNEAGFVSNVIKFRAVTTTV